MKYDEYIGSVGRPCDRPPRQRPSAHTCVSAYANYEYMYMGTNYVSSHYSEAHWHTSMSSSRVPSTNIYITPVCDDAIAFVHRISIYAAAVAYPLLPVAAAGGPFNLAELW